MSDTSAPTPVSITLPNNMTASNAASLPQADFQSQSSFQQRLLQFAITLAPQQSTGQPTQFTGTGSNTVTLEGFRSSVRIQNAGTPSAVQVDFRIYGMADSTMQQLAVLGQIFNSVQKNSILISAGNPNSGFTPVFGGTIFAAMPDYNQAPIVPLVGSAQSGYYSGVVPIPASSFAGSTDVATIMSGLAAQYQGPNGTGLAFENNGVSVQMPPTYLPGTLMQQLARVGRAANINWQIINDQKLAIWPKGGSRTSITTIPVVSAATGMIGYPTLSPNGYMIVRKIYDPTINFGARIMVMSSVVPQANRNWTVQKMDLELDSLVPKGKWRQILYCFPSNLPAPAPPSPGGG
jgi:hypothetical protein